MYGFPLEGEKEFMGGLGAEWDGSLWRTEGLGGGRECRQGWLELGGG